MPTPSCAAIDPRATSRHRAQGVLGAIGLATWLALSSAACGPKEEGTISIRPGDKTTTIEPDFGNASPTAAPVPGSGQEAAPKSIKR